MKFIVEKEVFEKLPPVCFGVVVAKGVDNKNRLKAIEDILESEIRATYDKFSGIKVKELPGLMPYREAFARLGFNPNKFLSSVEALITRIAKGGEFPKINNVVNLANALCLKHVVPMGAHDLDRIQGDIMVRFSQKGDLFVPFGRAETEAVEPGELVYADGRHVKTRKWIWRQSEIGKITDDSRNVFFPIDGFEGVNDHAVLSARDELARKLIELFSCEVKVGFIDAGHPELEIF